jgi:hypothetical protein
MIWSHLEPSGLLMLSGALHFLQIPSMYVLSRGGLNLTRDLEELSPINARLVVLFVAALTLLLLGLGGLVVFQHQQLLSSAFGRGVCWLLGVFWSLRVAAQCWLKSAWPMKGSGSKLYYGLLVLYAYLALSYLLVAAS